MSWTLTNRCASLADVLGYRHPGVVRRYAKDHQTSLAEAEEVFTELLKWLYLCWHSQRANATPCVMHPEIEKIDWMWHTFLLFTWDYADFCECHFGSFIHHVPNEDEEETPVDEESYRTELTRQYALVYNVLGEETLMAWYEHCRFAAPRGSGTE